MVQRPKETRMQFVARKMCGRPCAKAAFLNRIHRSLKSEGKLPSGSVPQTKRQR